MAGILVGGDAETRKALLEESTDDLLVSFYDTS